MTSRIKRICMASALGLPLLGCAPKEYATLRPDRAKWLEADPAAAANAKEAPEPAIMPKTYYAAGQLFEQQGQIGKAIAQYQRAIAAQNDYVPAYNRLGVLLGRMGRHAEAEEALRKAVGMRPDWAFLRNNLGYEYMLQERWMDAEAELRNALRLKPDFARAHNNLGAVLAKQGRFDEALAEFKEAMPESDALYNLGLMYRNENRYQDAAGAFERAVGLAPSFDEAKDQLAFVAPGREVKGEPARLPAAKPLAVASWQPPAQPVTASREIEPVSSVLVAPAREVATAAPAPSYIPKPPRAAAEETAQPHPWLVDSRVTEAPRIIQPIPAPPAANLESSVLFVEAQAVESPVIVETAPCEEIDWIDSEVAVIESSADDWAGESPADVVESSTHGPVLADLESEEPCEDEFAADAAWEPIESLADLGDEVIDAGADAGQAWEGRRGLLGWVWSVLQSAAPAAPVVTEETAFVGPIATVEPSDSADASAAIQIPDANLVLCDFAVDDADLFSTHADWREWVPGFDASVVFLSILRTDMVADEFVASSAISMITGE